MVAAWLLADRGYAGVSVAAGSSFNTNLSLPGTDSQAAATLLTQNFPAASGEGDQVVIQAAHGATIKSAPVQSAVTAALAKVAKVPGVETVASPYAKDGRGADQPGRHHRLRPRDLGQAGRPGDYGRRAEPDQGGGIRGRRRTSTSRSAASPSTTSERPSIGISVGVGSPRRWPSC